MTSLNDAFPLPYADLVERLLSSIADSLLDLCERGIDVVTDADISWRFQWLEKARPRGRDEHLLESPLVDTSLRASQENWPAKSRIGQIILRAYEKALIEAETSSVFKGILLPSPLRILTDILTVPEEPASRAFALVTVRAYLFRKLQITPALLGIPSRAKEVSIEDVQIAIQTVRTHRARRDNIPPVLTYPGRHLVYQMLAIDGILNLRFKGISEIYSVFSERRFIGATEAEFRVSLDIERSPDVPEMINRIWGVPLPIRGADTVFYGGLKFAADGGLIAAVTGAPGTGKTSLGLFLAIMLAPIGARTVLVTTEEAPADLQVRLSTLTPEYMRRLSFFDSQIENWFRAFPMPVVSEGPSQDGLSTVLSELRKMVGVPREIEAGEAPLPCPFIVILDGIQNYFVRSFSGGQEDDNYSLASFVRDCRNLGALVLVTFANKQKELSPLEYLVDLVIDLEYKYTDRLEKPVRQFILQKSRHQLSRPGTHICHFSGDGGFRIAAQLPSQLDQRSKLRFLEPDEANFIDILNRPYGGKPLDSGTIRNNAFIEASGYPNIYRRSHVLVHGRGSTGKAGFGLSLLAAPLVNAQGMYVQTELRRRILVISFLYPQEYYESLMRQIVQVLRAQYPGDWGSMPSITVEHFLPGYLNPEDLFARISELLDAGDLEGEPYTAVMFDGLHNTFLQFPRLEENGMVWPMLYGMLRTRNVTVVSTHTTFSIKDSLRDEIDLAVKRSRPLLHALVQAADFFFEVELPMLEDRFVREDHDDEIEVKVTSARGQQIPKIIRYWHRERLVVYGYDLQRSLPLPIPAQTGKRRRRQVDPDTRPLF